jgi:hypothetical protein
MVTIFVSYSRVDVEITQDVVTHLRRVYGLPNVWYDDEIHGGQRWWKAILEQIGACNVFVYLLSNESVTSPYCKAEFTEARRLQKPIVTVQVRDRTKLSDDLSEIQYVDMKHGLNADNLARLVRAINELGSMPKRRHALWKPQTLLPDIPESEQGDSEPRPDVETPTLIINRPLGRKRGRLQVIILLVVVVVILAILAIIAVSMMDTGLTDRLASSIATTTQGVADVPSHTITLAPSFTATPSASPTATEDFGATQVVELQTSLTALALQQFVGAQTSTANAMTQSASNELQGTLSALADIATADVLARTQSAIEATATWQSIHATWTQEFEQSIRNSTNTAEAWTATPTNTLTPTLTPTASPTIPTPTNVATAIPFSESLFLATTGTTQLHSGPSTTFSVVATLGSGETLHVIAVSARQSTTSPPQK